MIVSPRACVVSSTSPVQSPPHSSFVERVLDGFSLLGSGLWGVHVPIVRMSVPRLPALVSPPRPLKK